MSVASANSKNAFPYKLHDHNEVSIIALTIHVVALRLRTPICLKQYRDDIPLSLANVISFYYTKVAC